MESEQNDVIRHLLQIEDEALTVIKEAQSQSDAILSKARAETEAEFKKELEKINTSIEKKEKTLKQKILDENNSHFQDYKDSLSSLNKDFDSFNSLVDELLKA